jgi:hypothetical protein
MKDIELMVGFRLYIHWWIVWVIIVPALLTVSLFLSAITAAAIELYVTEQIVRLRAEKKDVENRNGAKSKCAQTTEKSTNSSLLFDVAQINVLSSS